MFLKLGSRFPLLNTFSVLFKHSDLELRIPYVTVSEEDGTKFLNNIGANAMIEVDVFGGACYPNYDWDGGTCNNEWRCLGGDFCEYKQDPTGIEGSSVTYKSGECIPCPVDVNTGEDDPWGCYFNTHYDNQTDSVDSFFKTVQNVVECAKSCGAGLIFKSCKFCPLEVAAFEFGVEIEEDRCTFCPANDAIYHEKIVPLYRLNGVTCWQLESFFNKLPVSDYFYF